MVLIMKEITNEPEDPPKEKHGCILSALHLVIFILISVMGFLIVMEILHQMGVGVFAPCDDEVKNEDDHMMKDCFLLEDQPLFKSYYCPSNEMIYFRLELPTEDVHINEISPSKISDAEKLKSDFTKRKLLQIKDAIFTAESLGEKLTTQVSYLQEKIGQLTRKVDYQKDQERPLKPKGVQSFMTSPSGETTDLYMVKDLMKGGEVSHDPKPGMDFRTLFGTIISKAIAGMNMKRNTDIAKESEDHKNLNGAFEKQNVSAFIEYFKKDNANDTEVRYPPVTNTSVVHRMSVRPTILNLMNGEEVEKNLKPGMGIRNLMNGEMLDKNAKSGTGLRSIIATIISKAIDGMKMRLKRNADKEREFENQENLKKTLEKQDVPADFEYFKMYNPNETEIRYLPETNTSVLKRMFVSPTIQNIMNVEGIDKDPKLGISFQSFIETVISKDVDSMKIKKTTNVVLPYLEDHKIRFENNGNETTVRVSLITNTSNIQGVFESPATQTLINGVGSNADPEIPSSFRPLMETDISETIDNIKLKNENKYNDKESESKNHKILNVMFKEPDVSNYIESVETNNGNQMQVRFPLVPNTSLIHGIKIPRPTIQNLINETSILKARDDINLKSDVHKEDELEDHEILNVTSKEKDIFPYIKFLEMDKVNETEVRFPPVSNISTIHTMFLSPTIRYLINGEGVDKNPKSRPGFQSFIETSILKARDDIKLKSDVDKKDELEGHEILNVTSKENDVFPYIEFLEMDEVNETDVRFPPVSNISTIHTMFLSPTIRSLINGERVDKNSKSRPGFRSFIETSILKARDDIKLKSDIDKEDELNDHKIRNVTSKEKEVFPYIEFLEMDKVNETEVRYPLVSNISTIHKMSLSPTIRSLINGEGVDKNPKSQPGFRSSIETSFLKARDDIKLKSDVDKEDELEYHKILNVTSKKMDVIPNFEFRDMDHGNETEVRLPPVINIFNIHWVFVRPTKAVPVWKKTDNVTEED